MACKMMYKPNETVAKNKLLLYEEVYLAMKQHGKHKSPLGLVHNKLDENS